MTKKGRPPLHMAVRGEHAPGLLQRLDSTLKDAERLLEQLHAMDVRVVITTETRPREFTTQHVRLHSAERNNTPIDFRRK